MALAGQVGELVAEFQWLDPHGSETEALSDAKRRAVEDEVADVLLYLIQLADRLNIDLGAAGLRKPASNAERYPVADAHGSARKAP